MTQTEAATTALVIAGLVVVIAFVAVLTLAFVTVASGVFDRFTIPRDRK